MASNSIYQCMGVQQGIWLLEVTATHPLTMISRIKLLQLIHINWLCELISVQVCQPGSSLSSQISDDIRSALTRSKLASRVVDQLPEDFQDQVTSLKFPGLNPLSECMSHLPLIDLNMICCPQSLLIQQAKLIIMRLGPLGLGYMLLQCYSQRSHLNLNRQHCLHTIHQRIWGSSSRGAKRCTISL